MTADAWGGSELAPPPEDHMSVNDYEAAEQQQDATAFAMDVARETHRLRVRDSAKQAIEHERAADALDDDYDDQFLTRSQLKSLPSPEPLIEGVLPRHSYIILRGRDHSLKSFTELDWALCLATGKPWQGRHTEQVRVLYIAGEGAYGIEPRVDAWEQAWGIEVPDDMFTVRKTALNLFKPDAAFGHLTDLITAGGYGFVIVDTLRRVSGAADGNGSEMGAVIDNLDQIKRATLNGSVSVVSHTDKGDNDSRGYSGIEDDADVVWHAKRNEDDLTLTNTKMKDGPDGHKIDLRAKKVAASLILEAASPNAGTPIATQSQVDLVRTLQGLFPEGAASGVLLKASAIPPSTYYRAVAQLLERHFIENTGTPKRPFYRLVPQTETPTDSHPTPTNGATL